MKFIESFVIALRSLFANKLRSSLTMLGMVIGVGAVIVLLSVGAGLQNYITSTFEEMGSNLLFVSAANPDAPDIAAMAPGMATASLTMDDAEAMRDIRPVIAVHPTNASFVKLIVGNESVSARVGGTTPEVSEGDGVGGLSRGIVVHGVVFGAREKGLLCSGELPREIGVGFAFIGEAGIHADDHGIRGFDVSEDVFEDIAHLLGRLTCSSARHELESEARLRDFAYGVTHPRKFRGQV